MQLPASSHSTPDGPDDGTTNRSVVLSSEPLRATRFPGAPSGWCSPIDGPKVMRLFPPANALPRITTSIPAGPLAGSRASRTGAGAAGVGEAVGVEVGSGVGVSVAVGVGGVTREVWVHVSLPEPNQAVHVKLAHNAPVRPGGGGAGAAKGDAPPGSGTGVSREPE